MANTQEKDFLMLIKALSAHTGERYQHHNQGSSLLIKSNKEDISFVKFGYDRVLRAFNSIQFTDATPNNIKEIFIVPTELKIIQSIVDGFFNHPLVKSVFINPLIASINTPMVSFNNIGIPAHSRLALKKQFSYRNALNEFTLEKHITATAALDIVLEVKLKFNISKIGCFEFLYNPIDKQIKLISNIVYIDSRPQYIYCDRLPMSEECLKSKMIDWLNKISEPVFIHLLYAHRLNITDVSFNKQNIQESFLMLEIVID